MNLSIKNIVLLVIGVIFVQFLPAQSDKENMASVRKQSHKNLREVGFGGIYVGYSLPVPLWKSIRITVV
ncbi:hypothetical protein NBRC110019_08280 [Neptunitalea chrysea]|uniref:Uncharacterized protein n=1 Tax=Neptunitalea chrysea TaxID=1647581 RepID=A0A9W6B3H9_9FLAO|nr:hypothetical protein [Neptunitalea chrysea]GLB51789.1 hypothetical protein NBRC110019_08280 [Neptunitalea chrysea]